MNIREYEEKTGQSVHSPGNQQILGRLVSREIVTNVSMLVSHFAQNPEAVRGSDYNYDEIIDLCRNIDYEEAAMSWLENEAEHDDLVEIVNDYDLEVEGENLPKHELVGLIVESINDWQDFCIDEDIETEDFELDVLEHWIVSKWLKDKLNKYGETTGELFGLDIWGRTTSGQAICMDYIIARITADMGVLAGQHNSWEDRK